MGFHLEHLKRLERLNHPLEEENLELHQKPLEEALNRVREVNHHYLKEGEVNHHYLKEGEVNLD